ncbi:MAG: acetyltransferase [Oligoflexia bacterium]|nr:acetyltransferase [Oligoflexia bacterium]
MLEVAIFGCGGHAKVVADIIEVQNQFRIACFVSDKYYFDSFIGYECVVEADFWSMGINRGVVAIGDNWTRYKKVENILSHLPEFKFSTLVHPSATVARGVTVGEGTVVMAKSVVNTSSLIGKHVIINTNSSVDHDCFLDDFSSIGPGTTLGGSCAIGGCSAISLGASLIHKIKVGKNSVIGAGSLVIRDVGDGIVAYGHPCVEIRKRESGESYL